MTDFSNSGWELQPIDAVVEGKDVQIMAAAPVRGPGLLAEGETLMVCPESRALEAEKRIRALEITLHEIRRAMDADPTEPTDNEIIAAAREHQRVATPEKAWSELTATQKQVHRSVVVPILRAGRVGQRA